MGEIYHLHLNARLVVLSACETGLGKVASGEGILGFSRAFLLAGARNLLLSLWQVNDTSTTELMTRFYTYHLIKERSLADALRRAKLDLIGNSQTAHPFFWAGFVLSGN
jgi:CHAT domain-containing protein